MEVRESFQFHEKECGRESAEIRERTLTNCYDKLDDLENRSRRKNLIFFGISEGEEKGKGVNNMINFMHRFLSQFEPGGLQLADIETCPSHPHQPSTTAQ